MLVFHGLGADNSTTTTSSRDTVVTSDPVVKTAPVTSKLPYACTLTYCYGLTSARISELKTVQAEANNLAALLGSAARVPVDGKIDNATIKLIGALAAARKVSFKLPLSQTNVAANPLAFVAVLQAARPSAVADVKITFTPPPAAPPNPAPFTPPAPEPQTTAPPADPTGYPGTQPQAQPGAGTHVDVSPAMPVPPPATGKWKIWAAVGAGVAALAAGVVAAKHGS